MRLIDADALRKRMFSYYKCVNENSSKEYYRGETLMNYEVADLIEDCIDEAPTVDAVELPCRIGDEVWGLKDYYGRKIPKLGVVNQMYFGEDMRLCICVKNVCRGEWGKNVFATKEEAEAAIERRTDNDV